MFLDLVTKASNLKQVLSLGHKKIGLDANLLFAEIFQDARLQRLVLVDGADDDDFDDGLDDFRILGVLVGVVFRFRQRVEVAQVPDQDVFAQKLPG